MVRSNLDRWIAWRLGAIIAAAALVGWLASVVVIQARFTELEVWLVERQLQRVERLLQQETADVERIAADYAQWDDTLEYLGNPSREYVEANFPRNTGENLNIDAVMILDGGLNTKLAIDLGGAADFDAWSPRHISDVKAVLSRWPADDGLRRDSRLMFLEGRPTVVGRVAVTDSEQRAPSPGSLVFVRMLDAEDQQRLISLSDVAFTLTQEPEASDSAGVANVVRRGNVWEGEARLPNGIGLVVEVPALLSGELRATAVVLALTTSAVLIICVLWVFRTLRLKVTGRLRRFAEVTATDEGGASKRRRWPVEGDDEIDRLAKALNSLADAVEIQEEALDRLAHEDLVTGLINRRRLLALLSGRLQSDPNEQEQTDTLIYFDLVGFKAINDALGHAAGDSVLRTLGDRLRALPAPVVAVARIGGDEFGLLLEGVGMQRAASWFSDVIDGLVAEVSINGQPLRFDLIAGIAEKPVGEEATAWLSMADLAMCEAKRRGRGRIGLYALPLREAVQQRHELSRRLIVDIDMGAIDTWFQPIVAAEDGRIVGFEALARWQSNGQWVPPDQFIPIAEESGHLLSLTRQVIRRAGNLLAELDSAGFPGLICSINVSPQQVANHYLPSQLDAALRPAGVEANRIAIEVTEAAIETRPEWVAETLAALRSRGFAIWLDDFGSGHASFARLRDYPFDRLKVDRDFIRRRSDPTQQGLLEGIIQFSQRIGLPVTAEGVETREDLEALHAMGCDCVQGYFIGRPMPASDLLAWVSSRVPI